MNNDLSNSTSIVERLPLTIILELFTLIKDLAPSLTLDQRTKVGMLCLCFAEKCLTGGDLLTNCCLEATQSAKDITSEGFLEGMLQTFYSSVKSTKDKKGEPIQ